MTTAKIAVVGAGWWAQEKHLPLLKAHSHADIVAIVEPLQQPHSNLMDVMDNAEQLREKYDCEMFSSVDDLFASGLQIDGLIIASPHATHGEIAIKGMEHKCHILCEKPLTTDVKEAIMLVKKVADYPDKVFMINNSANYRPKAVYIHSRLVKACDLGDIKHVSASFHVPLAKIFEDPANEGWIKPVGNMQGNGFCWGQLSHTLAWIYQMTGLTPVKVHAFLGLSEITNADIYSSINISCSNGGTISISGVGVLPGDTKHVSNVIVGTKGILRYGGSAHGKEPDRGQMEWRFHEGQGEDETIDGFEFENLNTGECDGSGPESVLGFIDACLGQQCYIGADVEIGYKAVATIDAIYRSAKSGDTEEILAQV